MEDTGAEYRGRRKRIGLTIQELAAEAGIGRDTLSDIEHGVKRARQSTLRQLGETLDRLEEEAGVRAPAPPASPGVVRLVVEGVYGAKAIIVEAPPDNIAALEAAVDRIMRNLRDDDREE